MSTENLNFHKGIKKFPPDSVNITVLFIDIDEKIAEEEFYDSGACKIDTYAQPIIPPDAAR